MDPRVVEALEMEDRQFKSEPYRYGNRYVQMRDDLAKEAMRVLLWSPSTREDCAGEAYRIADAMLAARNA